MWGPTACCLKATKEARLLEMKVCFIFDAGTWCRGREGCVPAQRLTLPPLPHPTPPIIREQEFLWTEGGGYVQKEQSALAVILKLVISGLTSVILIVLGTVSVQFQGPLVPISLRPVLRVVATHIRAMVRSSCS